MPRRFLVEFGGNRRPFTPRPRWRAEESRPGQVVDSPRKGPNISGFLDVSPGFDEYNPPLNIPGLDQRPPGPASWLLAPPAKGPAAPIPGNNHHHRSNLRRAGQPAPIIGQPSPADSTPGITKPRSVPALRKNGTIGLGRSAKPRDYRNTALIRRGAIGACR